jgi:head-tail adaptor
MTASDLREWIAIFQMDLVPDGQGGAREAIPPGLVADLPAAVKTPTPRVIFESDQLDDRIRYIMTIRFEPGITTSYRVMWQDRYYDIVGVKNMDERNTWLELICERNEAGKQ